MDIDTAKNLLSDPAELVRFMAAPRAWVIERGLDPDDSETAQIFERLLQSASEGLRRGIEAGGVQPMGVGRALQGIGFGCCNSL